MRFRQILNSIGWAVQLAVFMLVFAALAGGLLTPFVLRWVYGYDHGRGETERSLLACAILGAVLGTWLHVLNRSLERRRADLWSVLVAGTITVGGFVVVCLMSTWVPGAHPRTQCLNNLRNIGMALQSYHDEHGRFPPAYLADEAGRPMHSWRVLLLPYLDRQALYRTYRFDEPWNGPNNRQLIDVMMPVYSCPSDREKDTAHTNYVVVVGPETMFPGSDAASLMDLRDAPGSTVLVIEVANSGIHWMEPRDLPMAQVARGTNASSGTVVGARHQGINVFLADGHARILPEDIDPVMLRGLLTRNGAEELNVPFEF